MQIPELHNHLIEQFTFARLFNMFVVVCDLSVGTLLLCVVLAKPDKIFIFKSERKILSERSCTPVHIVVNESGVVTVNGGRSVVKRRYQIGSYVLHVACVPLQR